MNSLFQPLVLGGDHSVSDGIMGGLKKAGQLKNAAILHFDAHPDMIASRFGIEHCFTTWAYNALDGIKNPAQFVQIGIIVNGKRTIGEYIGDADGKHIYSVLQEGKYRVVEGTTGKIIGKKRTE